MRLRATGLCPATEGEARCCVRHADARSVTTSRGFAGAFNHTVTTATTV
jgi:hypothetical protein